MVIPEIVRFKKESYRGANSRGDVPRWHIAAYPYDKKVVMHMRYIALCGYEIKNPWLPGVPTMLSYAKKPRGQHCLKCIAKQEERE